jgi:hypothetical protein
VVFRESRKYRPKLTVIDHFGASSDRFGNKSLSLRAPYYGSDLGLPAGGRSIDAHFIP